jgi:hypothetical protein
MLVFSAQPLAVGDRNQEYAMSIGKVRPSGTKL